MKTGTVCTMLDSISSSNCSNLVSNNSIPRDVDVSSSLDKLYLFIQMKQNVIHSIHDTLLKDDKEEVVSLTLQEFKKWLYIATFAVQTNVQDEKMIQHLIDMMESYWNTIMEDRSHQYHHNHTHYDVSSSSSSFFTYEDGNSIFSTTGNDGVDQIKMITNDIDPSSSLSSSPSKHRVSTSPSVNPKEKHSIAAVPPDLSPPPSSVSSLPYTITIQSGQIELLSLNPIPKIESKLTESVHLDVMKTAQMNGCPLGPWICSSAAEHGHLEVLQWARSKHHNCPWDSKTCSNAALNGHLHILKWAHPRGCPWDSSTCSNAALNGHLHVIVWARINGCKWDEVTCSNAIQNGHYNILQFAINNGCPFHCADIDSILSSTRVIPNDVFHWMKDTLNTPKSAANCCKLALDGQLGSLKQARILGYPWNEVTCSNAASAGHLELLIWARENGCPWNKDTCSHAAKSGHLEILKWAKENGCPWDKDTCSAAAISGHLEILKWAKENGCPWNEVTCKNAAFSGHLKILIWARENGCPWNEGTCRNAAFAGHLEILKWARENGCPWNKDTCSHAAKSGHLEILKWAKENGCPWNENTCSYAAYSGHLEILKWARENGCPWDMATCGTAAKSGHLEILKWAKKNGCPWDDGTCFVAASNGHIEVLKWAYNNGCPLNKSQLCIVATATAGHVETLSFLLEHGNVSDVQYMQEAVRSGRLTVSKPIHDCFTQISMRTK